MHQGYPRWLNSGADFLEIDVRRSKDGVYVISHDEPRPGARYATFEEVLQAAARADPGVDEFGNDDAAVHCYGRISISASSGESNQISTMSAFDTAMQPSVQSRVS